MYRKMFITLSLILCILLVSACGVPPVRTTDHPLTKEPVDSPTVTPAYVAGTQELSTHASDVDAESQKSETQVSELVSLDDTYNLYTNYALGFSIKVPKSMALSFGGCVYNEEQSSYRPQLAMVPTAIFETSDAVYLTFEHYAELQGKTVITSTDGGTRAYFSECIQVENSLELILNPDQLYKQMWKIQIVDISSEVALENFLKERYGSGCMVGDKTATSQDGVYRVSILGDGKHFTESTCPINFATAVNYDTLRGKVAVWDLGQAATFAANTDYTETYDQTMVDSFRFID